MEHNTRAIVYVGFGFLFGVLALWWTKLSIELPETERSKKSRQGTIAFALGVLSVAMFVSLEVAN